MTLEDDVSMAREYREKRLVLWRALFSHPSSGTCIPLLAEEIGRTVGGDPDSSDAIDESGTTVRMLARRVLDGDKPSRYHAGAWKTYHERVSSAWDEFVRARQKWASRHLRLTYWTIQRVPNAKPYLEDLIQDGHEGLMRAIDRYDPDTGYRFFTYAVWWIRCAIFRGLHSQNLVRIPEKWRQQLRVLAKASEELMVNGIHPTHERLSDYTGISIERIRRVMNAPRKRVKFSQVSTHDPESIIERTRLVRRIRSACNDLPEREKRIVTRRFGLEDEEPAKLRAIGQEFGVSRERIRQIQVKSLSKLQEALEHRQSA